MFRDLAKMLLRTKRFFLISCGDLEIIQRGKTRYKSK